MLETPPTAPIDIATALSANALARAELMDAIDALPADHRAEPAFDGWSVEDLVLHLAIWQEAAARSTTAPTADRSSCGVASSASRAAPQADGSPH